MEALLLNTSAIYLKWKAPELQTYYGKILSYHIIIRGFDPKHNASRMLTNVSVDASTPTLLIANLTQGITYSVTIAAVNKAGIGAYSKSATLRLDPHTKRLDDTPNHHHTIDYNHVDDFFTQSWFIILLGLTFTFIILSFAVLVIVKRKQIFLNHNVMGTRITGEKMFYLHGIS